MIERFPHEQSYLQRTKLRYVNLPNLLNDGKLDRLARVPGYVALYLGDAVDLIFLLHGEPATAARVSARGRAVVSVRSVLDRANAAVERAYVAYHGAPVDQLAAMLATIRGEPVLTASELNPAQPGRMFTMLRERRFDGVLEVREGTAAHYLVLENGLPKSTYLVDRRPGETDADALARLFDRDRARGLTVAAYPGLEGFPIQAPIALVQLYSRIIREAVEAVGARIGTAQANTFFSEALERARARHPALATYRLGPDGRVESDPIDPPEAVTAAVAEWLGDALLRAERAGAIDGLEVLARITRGHRYALDAQGFFRWLPSGLSE